MCSRPGAILRDERGFILGASILISAVLLLAGVLALWTSTTEMHVVRNEGDLTREFYASEAAVIDALENYDRGTTGKGEAGATHWLTDQFLLDGPLAANYRFFALDAQSRPIAEVRVRCITDAAVAIDFDEDGQAGPAETAANDLPRQRHISAPPPGSGFSLKYFEIRRYGITATSLTGNTRVQVGAYKVFNKYQ